MLLLPLGDGIHREVANGDGAHQAGFSQRSATNNSTLFLSLWLVEFAFRPKPAAALSGTI